MPRTVILSMGEALAEFVQVGSHALLDQEGTYRGPFASGAPLIFATAVARLGGRSTFLGTVGRDAFGEAVTGFLAKEGVDYSGIAHSSALPTSASFVVNHPDGTRSFFFHMRNGAAGLPPPLPATEILKQVAWVHVNGSCLAMNDAWWEYCILVARLVREAGGRVSLDPNIRAELASPEQIRALVGPILDVASIVFPSGEEAQLITGTTTPGAACTVLREAPHNEAVVLKQGPDGCTVYSRSGTVSVPSFPVEEVDATGAGDTFDAAFLWALQRGASLETAALWANAAGALSVTVTGPIDGAPRQANIDAYFAHARKANCGRKETAVRVLQRVSAVYLGYVQERCNYLHIASSCNGPNTVNVGSATSLAAYLSSMAATRCTHSNRVSTSKGFCKITSTWSRTL